MRNRAYRSQLRGWDEEISHGVAGADLRAMVAAGLLRAHGRNRGAFYDAGDPLRAVREATLRARVPIDIAGLFDPDDVPPTPTAPSRRGSIAT